MNSSPSGLKVRYQQYNNEPTCHGSTSFIIDRGERTPKSYYTYANKWVCVRVESSQGVYGYGKIFVNSRVPNISISYTKDKATASASGVVASSWQNFKSGGSGAPRCDSSASYSSASSSGNEISLSGVADDEKWVCFRVKKTVSGTDYYGYSWIQLDLARPGLTLTQNLKKVQLTNTSGLSGIGYFSSSGKPANCSDSKTTGWTTGTTTTDQTIGHWVCFRGKNAKGIYGYSLFQLKQLTPEITISQTPTKATAQATTPPGSTIVAASWKNFITTTTTEPTCDGNDTYTNTGSSAKEISLTKTTDDGKWVCFQVKNNTGLFAYKKLKIDLGSPAVYSYQSGLSLRAYSYAADLPASPVWQYAGPKTTAPDCSSLTTGWSNGAIVNNPTNGKHYCFRLADGIGNYGYDSIKAKTTAPTINLTKTNASVIASGTDLTDYASFLATDDPGCGPSNIVANWQSGRLRSGFISPVWVCFKAKNSLGVYGYAKIKATPSGTTIAITQDQDSVDATATNTIGSTIVSSSWSNFKQATEPTCDGNDTYTNDRIERQISQYNLCRQQQVGLLPG